jgi:hypothetical protein
LAGKRAAQIGWGVAIGHVVLAPLLLWFGHYLWTSRLLGPQGHGPVGLWLLLWYLDRPVFVVMGLFLGETGHGIVIETLVIVLTVLLSSVLYGSIAAFVWRWREGAEPGGHPGV